MAFIGVSNAQLNFNPANSMQVSIRKSDERNR